MSTYTQVEDVPSTARPMPPTEANVVSASMSIPHNEITLYREAIPRWAKCDTNDLSGNDLLLLLQLVKKVFTEDRIIQEHSNHNGIMSEFFIQAHKIGSGEKPTVSFLTLNRLMATDENAAYAKEMKCASRLNRMGTNKSNYQRNLMALPVIELLNLCLIYFKIMYRYY